VILKGTQLDLITAKGEVVFGGTKVPFEVLSPTQVKVKTPPHEVGLASVTISDGVVQYTATDVFLYTGKVPDDSPMVATLVEPATYEMKEGDTSPAYKATLYVAGLTDLPNPDPSGIKAQIGWGTKGTRPWEDPSWQWQGAELKDTSGGLFTYEAKLTVAVGGYLNVAVRYSMDGGTLWQFGDMDGSENGYDPEKAAVLTVWGVPRAGSIVVNELMWMGSKDNTKDEWFELRNMTPAPIDLKGFKLTGAGPVNSDFVFDATTHFVRNTVIPPYGYFLVSQFDSEPMGNMPASAIDVKPDIVGKNTMVLPNPSSSQPALYKLMSPDGKVIDMVVCTGNIGDLGQGPNKPVKSMERNKVPGDGSKDSSWHTAYVHTGWDGDPKQISNYGTPGGPNSDIPECAADADCGQAFPKVQVGQCEKKACDTKVGRCDILPIADGGECDDGLFCTVGETCQGGECKGGKPRDCADSSACTLDSCDEENDKCVSIPDPKAVEGPATSETCSDGKDNDCDNLVDGDDPQCRLRIDSVEPALVPCPGEWGIVVKGDGFDLPVTGVHLGQHDLAFNVDGPQTISAKLISLSQPADFDLSVTDGQVTAVLAKAVRCMDIDNTIWGNTQWPVDPITVAVGEKTDPIFGRVWAAGVTDTQPVDGAKVIAEIGYGPAGGDPFLDPDWRWFKAEFNAQCLDCGDNYEYMASLTFDTEGEYIVAFRYSVDGGYHYQFGDLTLKGDDGTILTDGSADGWDPSTALSVTVTPAP